MCGIAGCKIFSESNPEFPMAESLEAMAKAMVKRGPDSEGFWSDTRVGLAHRRLSILDLETGNQPMVGGDVVVVFNGEIYNFNTLRAELLSLGAEFSTASDTEVLLHGYRVWGMEGLLLKLEGMFAFALFDTLRQVLYLVRDRFGEKPLYYGSRDGVFYFSSELKGLQSVGLGRELDGRALRLFLQLSYIPAPMSIYGDIHKLEAGTYLEVGTSVTQKRYYDLRHAVQQKKQSLQVVLEGVQDSQSYLMQEIRRLLTKSVAEKMQSDVPMGTFLSGGVDSSIVSYLVKGILDDRSGPQRGIEGDFSDLRIQADAPLRTFSIGFAEKSFDESARSDRMSAFLGSEHSLKTLDYGDVLPLVNDIVGYFDEPFGDSSCLPTFAVAALAKERVSVVLTGDCADELFGGYEKYLFSHYVQRWNRVPKLLQGLVRKGVGLLPTNAKFNPLIRKFRKVDSMRTFSGSELSFRLMCMGFQPEELQELLVDTEASDLQYEDFMNTGWGRGLDCGRADSSDFLNNSMLRDVETVLEGDMLVKVDRMCMMNSLEARVPFLETELVEFALALDASWKIDGKERKWILREAFRGLVPNDILDNSKKGFGVPVDFWFRGPLKAELQRLLNRASIEKQGLFRWDCIERLMQEHFSEERNHKGKLWNLFVFQKWYERQTQGI